MPSFPELKDHLRAKFKLIEDKPETFTIGFRFEMRPGKTEAHVVRGQSEVHGPDAYVVAWADVGDADFIDFREALTRNAQLMVGALALRDKRIVIRHAWPLATLQYPEIERGLQYLALGAAAMQQLVSPPKPQPPATPPDPNRHFSD